MAPLIIMGFGYLRVETRTANNVLPIHGAAITITDGLGQTLYRLTSDDCGTAESVSLYAPDKIVTLSPESAGPFYALYNVEITHPEYITTFVRGVQVFDTIESVLPANMLRAAETSQYQNMANTYNLPPNMLLSRINRIQDGPAPNPEAQWDVIVPESITVHLGFPGTTARNIALQFRDYLKNIAAGEFFPTWPKEALEANVRTIINFAMNRIYTKWYRERGGAFDITSLPIYDMAFAEGRNTFSNVNYIIDAFLGQYLRQEGYLEPYFTPFCNGSLTTCNGLSQWGTVTMANQGSLALEILRAYYNPNLEIAHASSIEGVSEWSPDMVLDVGSQGYLVETIQMHLNRIGVNFPQIPEVSPTGIYDEDTAQAVAVFQTLFNLPMTGVVDEATRNRIFVVNLDVARLWELSEEGKQIDIEETPPSVILRFGSRGEEVAKLQYLLSYLSLFFNIPTVVWTDSYDEATAAAVDSFQRYFNLSPTGIVGPADWNLLYEIYHNLKNIEIPQPPEDSMIHIRESDYPGQLLTLGSSGENVTLIQSKLNDISNFYPTIPKVNLDGIYDENTQEAVLRFQRQFGLLEDGIVGSITWNKIRDIHNMISSPAAILPQYPGAPLRLGSYGENVIQIQHYLNVISSHFSSIPILAEDGLFGPLTEQAVREFQRLFNLEQNGVVDQDTWDLIVNKWLEVMENSSEMGFP